MRLPALFALMLTGLVLSGCSSGTPKYAVDGDRARSALKATLDSWKQGQPPTAQAGVTVQDMDWEAGYRLVDYQVLDEGKVENANLRCPVALTLRDPQGREVKKKVKYIVGTSPAVTVLRELF